MKNKENHSKAFKLEHISYMQSNQKTMVQKLRRSINLHSASISWPLPHAIYHSTVLGTMSKTKEDKWGPCSKCVYFPFGEGRY